MLNRPIRSPPPSFGLAAELAHFGRTFRRAGRRVPVHDGWRKVIIGKDTTMTTMPDADACWQAVLTRDASADGRFYYAVRRPGVYCRPSCPSRRPKRENVSFHSSPEDAEAAGFRACLRCRPRAVTGTDPARDVVAAMALYIDADADAPLSLGDLARRAGYSRRADDRR